MKRVPCYVIEFRRTGKGDKVAVVHLIRIPDNIRGGRYRQLISVAAFHKKECLRVMRSLPYERRYSHKFADDVHDFLKTLKATVSMELILANYKDVKTVRHNNLWDFYEHIGYNYHTNQYDFQAHP